ncbi:acetylornithine deacetylase [Tepidamorphus gemmatus]|uniref:Acetylornithine deacetylase n=1 Tax=Tepidamorphus gemmatus TaxID=747076 RepID=A0A4V2UXE2_9HYPH|nr:acetylornithine deacetylase [Tepidamorphus gemmatus]TCT03138.1 acetylornithine deacetylase [Tepidamorphus gemmatus]
MVEISRTLALLERLVAFPTVSGEGNAELIGWAAGLLREAGFRLGYLPSSQPGKLGLVARAGPEAPGGVWLSAHADVVPVEGQGWTRPPFRLSREGERVFGRGVTDMKGFLAAALAMAERAGRGGLAAPLGLVISYDEEVGCRGIREMLPALAPHMQGARAVIVGEPTQMQVAIGHKGKTALRVTFRGEAGHSAEAPRFVNAIHLAAAFVTEMRALQQRLAQGVRDEAYGVPYSTVHVGRIGGGRALNIVPEEAWIEMEFRHLAETPAAEIRSQIEAAARRVGAALGAPGHIAIEETAAYPGLATLPQAPVVGWARRMSGSEALTKVSFGTEAGFFAGLGLPVVVLGPGEMARDGHQPDESLSLDQLALCEAMLERVREDLRG